MKIMTLADLSINITDGTHSTIKDDINGSYVLLSCKNIRNGKINIGLLERKIGEETFKKLRKRTKLSKNDILITTVGTIGELAIVVDDNPNYDFQRSVGIIKPDVEKVFPRYLYYAIKTEMSQISNLVKGAVQQCLFLGDIKNIRIKIPDMNTQIKIANILHDIDNKIECNNQINNNLEQQAQAIYSSWFEKYEPFAGCRPSDWVDGTIDDLAKEIICGKTPSTKKVEYYGEDIPFITIPDMHGNPYIVATERKLSKLGAESQSKKSLPPNSICVSCIGTAGLVSLVSEESQTNQQINSIVPTDGYSPYYIFLLMKSLTEVINKLGQSGSTIVNLNKTQFGKISVTIPSITVMQQFDTVVSPLFKLILSNQLENIKLSSLRDVLLPQLMSGNIDVSDIDI